MLPWTHDASIRRVSPFHTSAGLHFSAEFDVPASGTIDYQRYTIANTTGRDIWMRASDTIPGDRTVLHHVLVGVYDPKLPERERMIRATSGELGAYTDSIAHQFDKDVVVFSLTPHAHYRGTGRALGRAVLG